MFQNCWSSPFSLPRWNVQYSTNFFAACRHGAKLNCPAELAYESAVAVLAANVSADTHKTHYFKPEDFKVPPRKA